MTTNIYIRSFFDIHFELLVKYVFSTDISDGLVVAASGIEDIEDFCENVVGTYIVEERHAGRQFQPVWISHQLSGISRWLVKDCLGDFPQMGVENLILEICSCLFKCPYSVEVRDSGMSKTAWLRENVPHPMPHLAPILDFLKRLLVSSTTLALKPVLMRVSEPRQIKYICHVVFFIFYSFKFDTKFRIKVNAYKHFISGIFFTILTISAPYNS